MKIHHINCGTLCPFGRRLLSGEGSLFEQGRLVCHCLVIEGPQGLVLVDTGFGTYDIAHPRETMGPLWPLLNRPRRDLQETAMAHVRRLGYAPQDVRDIVLTHLDFDHAGGLRDFPRATVHVSTIEHREANKTGRASFWRGRRYAPVQWGHGPHWNLYLAGGGEWYGFGGVRQVEGLATEVLLVPLYGHSRGHCGVAIKDGDRYLFHAGDAYFDHREIDPEHPDPPAGVKLYQSLYQSDPRLRYRNQQRLRTLVRHHSGTVEVICSHDPAYLEVDSRTPGSGTPPVPGREASGRERERSEPVKHGKHAPR